MASSPQDKDATNEILILGAFIIGLSVLLWYFFSPQIISTYLMTKKVEYYILKFTGIPYIFKSAWEMRVVPFEPFITGQEKATTLAQINLIGGGLGYFFRWYIVAGIGFWAYKLISKNPLQRFRREHNMKTLAASEQKLWPSIAPVVKLDLIKEPIDKGPWAMSKKPLDFARFYKLLDEGNKLNRDRAEKLFAAQLGKLWENPNRLPPYMKALFTAFAAQANGDLDGAKMALDNLSNTDMNQAKPDFSWVEPLLQKHINTPKVQGIMKKHAYVYTVMASMLKAAREFGVCASAQFVWLRPKNRALWYILNGMGRRVSFAEVGGIFAHWLAEEVAEHPIERPYVIKAVDGLEKALLEVKFD